MSELLFPLVTLACVVGLITPLLTLGLKGFFYIQRRYLKRWVSFGSNLNWTLIIAPSVLPVVWVGAASLSQALQPTVCLIDSPSEICFDDWFLSLSALLVLGLPTLQLWRTVRAQLPSVTERDSEKLKTLVDSHLILKNFRVRACSNPQYPVFTIGFWQPTIWIDACFLIENDDDVVISALLHEVEHARSRDPLRFFIAQAFLSINPARRWMQPELTRWHQAREAACDLSAIHDGTPPLSLALAILCAVKHRCVGEHHCIATSHLCESGLLSVRTRISLLNAYADASSPPPCERGNFVSFSLIIAATVVAALYCEPSLLNTLHHMIEAHWLQ